MVLAKVLLIKVLGARVLIGCLAQVTFCVTRVSVGARVICCPTPSLFASIHKKRQISEHAGRHSISALWLTHSACLLSLVPHSDPLPNGCHKTCKRSWLSTLLQQNCVCVCAHVLDTVCSSSSHLITKLVLRRDKKALAHVTVSFLSFRLCLLGSYFLSKKGDPGL